MVWHPHVTVATVIEKDNHYLLVYEHSENQWVYNQPAGHLEEGETLQEAAIRETLEETGWLVQLTAFIGVGLYRSPINNTTYIRNTFCADVVKHYPDRPLDEDIEQAVWLTYEEIVQRKHLLRSPMVLKVIEDYRSGKHYPLELLY